MSRGVPVILVDSSLDTSIARRHAIAAASSRCLIRAGSLASSRTCSCRERGMHDAYGRRRRMSEVSTSKYPEEDDGRFPTTSVWASGQALLASALQLAQKLLLSSVAPNSAAKRAFIAARLLQTNQYRTYCPAKRF